MNSRSRIVRGSLFLMLLFGGLVVMGQEGGTEIVIRQPTVLQRLQIERAMIYTPQSSWLYNHHPSITKFKKKFIAVWSDGMKDEDAPGQRVVYAVSDDFFHWSVPRVLATPSLYRGDTADVLTAAGFHRYGDSLVAYYGEYSPHREHTHLWAKVSGDGLHWSAPLDMGVPVNPNHGPQPAGGGRLIISGNFTFPYTDDPRGLSGWKMTSFFPDSLYNEDNPATFYTPAAKMGLPPLCEGSFFMTGGIAPGGDSVLHMLLRVTGKGWKGRLWVTESRDRGEHWSFPKETAFTDNDSKFHFGKLPDGRWYYVGIPDTVHHYARTPLVLAISEDGHTFDECRLIADELYTLKAEGLWKGGQYGYPHTMIDGGNMYVIISRQKESIEVLRFPLAQLHKIKKD